MKMLYNDFEDELCEDELFAEEDMFLEEADIISMQRSDNNPNRMMLIQSVYAQLEDILSDEGAEFKMDVIANNCRSDCSIVITVYEGLYLSDWNRKYFSDAVEEADYFTVEQSEADEAIIEITVYFENALA